VTAPVDSTPAALRAGGPNDKAPTETAPAPPRTDGPQKVVVSRGDRFDVAEWTPGEASWFGARAPAYQPSSSPIVFAIVASILVIVGTVFLLRQQTPGLSQPLVPTVADLQAVHAGVAVAGSPVRRAQRLTASDTVETDADGRARLRLDDGTVLVIDRSTKLALRDAGIAVERGRVFVQGAPGARAAIELGGATAIVSGADVGVERTGDGARVYVVTAEITVRSADKAETTVRAGDTATVSGSKVTVAPEKGYDDWTGGMAAPWAVSGAPRRAVGELWGRAPDGSGSPLTLRAHDVRATVTREVAETEVRTTFFNAGSAAVSGDYRMAVPPGAIVSRFATVRNESVSEGRLALAARKQSAATVNYEVLEWAGEGWVRGTVPSIAPGATVTVVVGYIEWLSPRPKGDGKTLVVQYRYPMVGDASPPLVGEFSARVDATPSSPISIASGLGARVSGQAVEVRRPDFRPTADLVVDVEIPPWKTDAETAPAAGSPAGVPRPAARLYAAPPSGDDDAGGTIVVRTETPRESKEDGVTLALVMDISASIEPALLDAERALVEAVLAGLGARDRAVVLAADQTVRPVGPAIGPVDAARRKAVTDALSRLSPGGASDLGRALEAGADALPPDAPAAMVIYLGDGWPTVGDASVDLIQARLARRPGGAPRLGAVAVGPLANRFGLAALTRGSGPLLEIADSEGAARVAIGLVAEALRPTVAGVEIGFGPEVERIYPRGARAVPAGDTVAAVGRVRGDLPREITLRWRDAAGAHEERRPLLAEKVVSEPDVGRRWAAARVEEIALGGRGREAATDVALRAGLLTPWTGWLVGSADGYVPTNLETRILDLAVGREAGFSASFATPKGSFGALAGVVHETEPADPEEEKEDVFKAAVAAAASRIIDEAGAAVRACRDSRAALRPELSGTLDVGLDLDGDGKASTIKVRGSAGADDEALDRCVEVVVEGLVFPASGLKVKVTVHGRVDLPPPRSTLRGRKCSPTSTLPMPLRRGVWRERLDRIAPATVYLDAKQGCELPVWTDRRALLELILLHNENGLFRVGVARELDRAGEADAAGLLRREAVRRAKSPDELKTIQRALIGDEHYPLGIFKKRYNAAADDAGRLGVVRRFLAIAPHDPRLRRRLLALLESLGMKQELADEVRRFRRDPFADAGLLADGASALRRIGDEDESRRAFGELAERAPGDPWARGFLGDRLRNEGWYDDATRAYTVLEQLVPDDPAAILRLALAHFGAGRLDIAERMLARVARTGGRAGDAGLGDMAGRLALDLLAEARSRPGLAAEDADRIGRAALELPRPPGATLLLLRAPAGARPITATLVRGPKEARSEGGPDVAAEGVGLYTMRIDPSDKSEIVLRLKRPAELAPARPTKVRVDALVPDGEGKMPRLVSTEVELPITGKPVELKWVGGAWVPG
jgi:tetratricopeptide (TPR) repeat protein